MNIGTRKRRPSVADLRRQLRSSLTAAAVPLLTTYDMSRGSVSERHFYEKALAAGLTEFASDMWPCEQTILDGDGAEFHDGGHCAIWSHRDGSLAYASLHGGWFVVKTAAHDLDVANAACFAFREKYPASYLTVSEEDTTVPITFWSMGAFGPQSRLRRIEASPWEPIAENYTADVRAELDGVMGWQNGPGSDGQLMLWQGPPGTGKTWALRALASEWAAWAEFHYITDPDSFFVDVPSYMIDVLLADSYSAVDIESGDIYDEQDADGKWRVLILEDTGELLSVNAKEKYGQGLSRLLNVVDGMIGQGLRVMCLVTTNDELGELTPAVKRPGRCASQLVFGPFDPAEASTWLGEEVTEAMTVAEMYARRGDPVVALEDDDVVTAAADPDVLAEIARVAAEHQPDESAYGETAFNAETGAVLWVSWDGTSNDEVAAIEADMLAIPGVESFDSEAEGLPNGWWDAEVVYPDDPPVWVMVRPEEDAALADVLALAAEPLVLDRETAALTPRESPLDRALDVLAQSHQRTVDGVTTLVASAEREHGGEIGHAIAARALDVLEQFAQRPDPAPAPAPNISVHIPQHDLNVRVDAPTIEVPAPQVDVHVAAAEPQPAPNVQVDVHVPEQAPQGDVHVHVPEQAAPVVHVTAAAPAPPPAPRAVRVEYDDDGKKWFIPEEVEA